MKTNNTTTWKKLKNDIYGKVGTPRRDRLEREMQTLKIGLQLREARERKSLTQEQLGQIVEKKRSFISRLENDGSNVTIKTLIDIVEKGLGGRVSIQIEI